MVLAAQLVLAAVFGVAGMAKLMDREGLPRAIASFGLPARTGSRLDTFSSPTSSSQPWPLSSTHGQESVRLERSDCC